MTSLKAVSFDAYELERLAATLDGAIRIRRRSDYYLWSQGALQSFLPHETLVCLHLGPDGTCHLELFSRNVIADDTESFLRMSKANLRAEVVLRWSGQGRRPYVQTPDDGTLVASLLEKMGSRHSLVHCAHAGDGQQPCVFIFLGIVKQPALRELYLAELLLPHLFFALTGLWSEQNAKLKRTLLSRRQHQVLAGVRRGKTNNEIALELGLSPLTVKSHVQQAFRKLSVSNRAEAAALTSAMTLTGDGTED